MRVAAPNSDAFPEVERRLRRILEPYRATLSVTREGPGGMALEMPGLEGKPWGFVAATKIGKSYVSFHLMSAYADPSIIASMSPELKRRMQGKSCFNFTKIDDTLFEELEGITAKGVARHPEMVASALAADPKRR